MTTGADVAELRAALLEEAAEEAVRSRSRVREQAEAILAEARREGARRAAQALADAESRAREIERRARRVAAGAAREALLRAQSAAVGDLRVAASARLRELRDSPRYRAALVELVAQACQALGPGDAVTVALAPEDMGKLDRDALERQLAGRPARVPAIEPAAGAAGGGAVVRAGSRLVDQSFSTRIERCLEARWPELAGELMPLTEAGPAPVHGTQVG